MCVDHFIYFEECGWRLLDLVLDLEASFNILNKSFHEYNEVLGFTDVTGDSLF